MGLGEYSPQVNVWLYSNAARRGAPSFARTRPLSRGLVAPQALQNKAVLRVKAPSAEVFAQLQHFVEDALPLDPGTYPRDLFKSPQDPTPVNAFSIGAAQRRSNFNK